MKQPNVMFRAIPREGQHNGCIYSVLCCRISGWRWEYPLPTRQAEGVSVRLLHPGHNLFLAVHSARYGLERIQAVLGGGGYVRDRGTGMSDLVITSRPTLLRILQEVEPYVIFKREHVGRALSILPQLDRVKDPEVFLHLARQVDAFATLNYSKTKRISAVDVERHLRSTGVLCPCNDFFASNSEEMASSG
jgi:hypothetical protein